MKNPSILLLSATLIGAVFVSSSAFAKTAKDCKAEWRADKVGMQSRGVTEKSYVDQCKAGAKPAAAAPAPQTSAGTPPVASKQVRSSSSSGKTAKDCIVEWRADKAGMQARGVTERSYVEQCRGNAAPTASAPRVNPNATSTQAPTQAAPPTRTETSPAPVPQRPSPSRTAAPVSSPQAPPTRGSATLETGQFADEPSAKARCPSDTVVWVNLPSKVYHFTGSRSYGTTKRGVYMCEKEAIAAENRASKTEKHP